MNTYSELGINIPNGRTTGQVYSTCPKCSEDRKKKSHKCLSINLDLGVWNCKNCGWHGGLNKKQYVLPKWENKTELPEQIVEWFVSRNINQATLLEMKISHATVYMPQVEAEMKCMCFNYFRGDKLVNIKYRDKFKNFRMHKDAELILYNLDGIYGQKEIFITEGECDALIMIQAGFKNTCSVPNGASPKHNNMEYLDNCWEAFSAVERVYIMTDNDAPGNNLADELARRIGVEVCFRSKFEQHKDVNDAVNEGVRITRELIDEISKPYPLVGVFQADQFWADLVEIRTHGFPKGWKPRGKLGEHVTFHPGYQTVVTGIPGHGKSEHLDQILIELGEDYGLKGAFYSPENKPTSIHLIKFIEKLSGKNMWNMSLAEIDSFKNWINAHMLWVMPQDSFDLTSILKLIRTAILRYGINWYVIDPWNKIDHQFEGSSEGRYISACLDEMERFNAKNNVHGFLIAHPVKMEKDKNGEYMIPNLYSISGSAHFFNKADIGWTVYKTGDGRSDVHIQKVKFKYWGHIGKIEYRWDKENGRYTVIEEPKKLHKLNGKEEKEEEAAPFPQSPPPGLFDSGEEAPF